MIYVLHREQNLRRRSDICTEIRQSTSTFSSKNTGYSFSDMGSMRAFNQPERTGLEDRGSVEILRCRSKQFEKIGYLEWIFPTETLGW